MFHVHVKETLYLLACLFLFRNFILSYQNSKLTDSLEICNHHFLYSAYANHTTLLLETNNLVILELVKIFYTFPFFSDLKVQIIQNVKLQV